MDKVSLTPRLLSALKDCESMWRHKPYIWRQASMKKLEAMGLVEAEPLICFGKVPYKTTGKGRATLSASTESE